MRTFVIGLGIVFSLTGCTTSLKSTYVSAAHDPGPGVLYNLPMAVFDVEAKFLVTGCTVTPGGNAKLSYELTDGSIAYRLAPDPRETYRIPYEALNSALKITTLDVLTYPNRMIKSINAEVDDRSAQVTASVAGTILNVFKASTLGFVPTSIKSASRCDQFLMDKIEARRKILDIDLPAAKGADKELAADREAADEVAAVIELAKAKLAEIQKAKGSAAALAAQKSELAKLQAQAEVANAKIINRKPQVTVLQTKLNSLSEALTASAKLTNWEPRELTRRATPAKMEAQEACTPMTADQSEFLMRLARSSDKAAPGVPTAANAEFEAQACVLISPYARLASNAREPAAGDPGSGVEGVIYRLPATGTVFVRETGNPTRRIYAANSVSLPQFGAKGLVWLDNKVFDKNSVKALFNEDGSLSQLTFKAEASAERGGAAAMDISKSLVDLMQMRSDAIKAKALAIDEAQKKAQQSQLDSLDFQIDLLGKRKEAEAARLPADPLDREKDQLQKKIDVETLRQQYEALKKKVEQS